MNDAPQAPLDERAGEQLFHRYFERIDANDPDGAAAHMTADVAFEVMIGERREGRERFARAVGRVLDGYTATSHHVTNFVSQLTGDEGTASMYVYAFHRMASTGDPGTCGRASTTACAAKMASGASPSTSCTGWTPSRCARTSPARGTCPTAAVWIASRCLAAEPRGPARESPRRAAGGGHSGAAFASRVTAGHAVQRAEHRQR